MGIKMKKLLILVLIAAILAIPTVYAYMFKRTSTVNNTFTTADIFTENPVIETISTSGTSVVKNSIKIKNTGNIESYIRIKFINYWVDSKGNVVGRASENLVFDFNSNDWIHDEINDVYYYKYPIVPGQITNEFLGNKKIELKHFEKTETYDSVTIVYEYNQVVEVHVEGIQASPADAIKAAWGFELNSDRSLKNPS